MAFRGSRTKRSDSSTVEVLKIAEQPSREGRLFVKSVAASTCGGGLVRTLQHAQKTSARYAPRRSGCDGIK